MQWTTVSKRHFYYFFTAKRGIILMITGLLLNGFYTYLRVGIIPDVSMPLTPSEISEIRNMRMGFSSILKLIWIVILAFEGAYLFNNGLFQRFLLNGFSRWQWGHSLLLNMALAALLLGLLQAAFINALGETLYGIQVVSWGYIFHLAVSFWYIGVLVLFLVALFPSYLAPLFVMAWQQVENLLNIGPIKQALLEVPTFLPFQILYEWERHHMLFVNNSGFLISYFLLFLVLFYTLIKRKLYD